MEDYSDDSAEVRRAMLYFALMMERVRLGQPARQRGDRELLKAIMSGRNPT